MQKTKKQSVKTETPKEKTRYIEAIGRRKTAIARVRIYPSTNKPLKTIMEGKEANIRLLPADKLDVTVNEKTMNEYFKVERLRQVVAAPFNVLNTIFKTSVMVKGSGPKAQAEAIRLGLARALKNLNEKWHTPLKTAEFLKRDPRIVERKKPGLRKARRPQQWRKR